MTELFMSSSKKSLLRRVLPPFVVAGLVSASMGLRVSQTSAEVAHVIPPPALDEQANPTAVSEAAIFAGGCFWGVQGVFQHVKGVMSAVSGYAGGEKNTAQYRTVSSGTTGHAESVQVTYDPHQITYGRLLQIYFSVAHDPTQLNRQGPDTGSQYRSAIFPVNGEQAHVAKTYIEQLNQAHVFEAPIITRTDPAQGFFPAEAYHQDFLTLNPDYPYIVVNDLPKIANLKRLFPENFRADPVLAATPRPPN